MGRRGQTSTYTQRRDAVQVRQRTSRLRATSVTDPSNRIDRRTKTPFNHTGASSENGILKASDGSQHKGELPSSRVAMHLFTLIMAGPTPSSRQQALSIADEFDYSLGFPMQDHSNHEDVTMLYGLDKHRSDDENGTDLGVARKMSRDNELTHARAIPIRTLHARLRAALPLLLIRTAGT